jgi:hypothetical protein
MHLLLVCNFFYHFIGIYTEFKVELDCAAAVHFLQQLRKNFIEILLNLMSTKDSKSIQYVKLL